MNAQRSLTITSADELTEVPARHRDRGILAILSTPTAEDVADFFEPVDPRDCTLVTFEVDGAFDSSVTFNTPRGDIPASKRCMLAVKGHLVRLRSDVAALECNEQLWGFVCAAKRSARGAKLSSSTYGAARKLGHVMAMIGAARECSKTSRAASQGSPADRPMVGQPSIDPIEAVLYDVFQSGIAALSSLPADDIDKTRTHVESLLEQLAALKFAGKVG